MRASFMCQEATFAQSSSVIASSPLSPMVSTPCRRIGWPSCQNCPWHTMTCPGYGLSQVSSPPAGPCEVAACRWPRLGLEEEPARPDAGVEGWPAFVVFVAGRGRDGAAAEPPAAASFEPTTTAEFDRTQGPVSPNESLSWTWAWITSPTWYCGSR